MPPPPGSGPLLPALSVALEDPAPSLPRVPRERCPRGEDASASPVVRHRLRVKPAACGGAPPGWQGRSEELLGRPGSWVHSPGKDGEARPHLGLPPAPLRPQLARPGRARLPGAGRDQRAENHLLPSPTGTGIRGPGRRSPQPQGEGGAGLGCGTGSVGTRLPTPEGGALCPAALGPLCLLPSRRASAGLQRGSPKRVGPGSSHAQQGPVPLTAQGRCRPAGRTAGHGGRRCWMGHLWWGHTE